MRYQSGVELRADLKRLKRDSDTGRITSAAQTQKPGPKRHAIPVIAAAALLAVAPVYWLSRPANVPRVNGMRQVTSDGLTKVGLVSDGSRVYFAENDGGRDVLAEVAASGGDTAIVPTPYTTISPRDISTEGSEILLGYDAVAEQESHVGVVPLPAGSPRSFNLSATGAAWSRDGRELVMTKGSAIYLADHDGGNVRKLSDVKLPGIQSAIFTRWEENPLHEERRHQQYELDMGDCARWQQLARSAAQFQNASRRVLRGLDSRWKVFPVPKLDRARERYLGSARRNGIDQPIESTFSADTRTARFQ